MLKSKSQRRTAQDVAVRYDESSHLGIIFQMYGSVWKGVMPFCLANCAITWFLYYSKSKYGLDVSIRDKGHVFMSVMVSFLVVQETHNSLNRYMCARRLLNDLIRNSRELIQHTVAFTRFKGHDQKSKDWRRQIAQLTIALLETVSEILKRPSSERDEKIPRNRVIKIYNLSLEEERGAMSYVNGDFERVPFVLILKLRSIIAEHVNALGKPLEAVHELVLLKFTADLSQAYIFLQQLTKTPYPFPLVQMTRTFLYMWVFTLPFALVDDVQQCVPLTLIIFFCTYGFVGLELISNEMEDPFGQDPNDFCVDALVNIAVDDIKLFVEDIDGKSRPQDTYDFTVGNELDVIPQFSESDENSEGVLSYGSSSGDDKDSDLEEFSV